MPPALPGEFSFASSGTCVATAGREKCLDHDRRRGYGEDSGDPRWRQHLERLRHSAPEFAQRWRFSVAFRDARHGIVAGAISIRPIPITRARPLRMTAVEPGH